MNAPIPSYDELYLRTDAANARFLWGAEVEYDIITAFENKTSNNPDEVYDGERGADQFEVSLVGYQVRDKGQMEGKVMLESTGHGQLDAMHLLAIGMQSMVKNSKRKLNSNGCANS